VFLLNSRSSYELLQCRARLLLWLTCECSASKSRSIDIAAATSGPRLLALSSSIDTSRLRWLSWATQAKDCTQPLPINSDPPARNDCALVPCNRYPLPQVPQNNWTEDNGSRSSPRQHLDLTCSMLMPDPQKHADTIHGWLLSAIDVRLCRC
jgi:hypothetical protein